MPPASGGILSGANAEINLVVIMLQIYNTGCRKSGYTPYSFKKKKKKSMNKTQKTFNFFFYVAFQIIGKYLLFINYLLSIT